MSLGVSRVFDWVSLSLMVSSYTLMEFFCRFSFISCYNSSFLSVLVLAIFYLFPVFMVFVVFQIVHSMIKFVF